MFQPGEVLDPDPASQQIQPSPGFILHFHVGSAGPGPFCSPSKRDFGSGSLKSVFCFPLCSQSCMSPPLGSSFSQNIQKYMWGFVLVFFKLCTSKTFLWTCELCSSVQRKSFLVNCRSFCLPALFHPLLVLLHFQRSIFHPLLSVLFFPQVLKRHNYGKFIGTALPV